MHHTAYTFSEPVWLQPHFLRVYPIQSPTLSASSFTLQMSPEPAGKRWYLDANGNSVCHAWFSGTATSLVIDSVLEIMTWHRDPFLFVYHPLAAAYAKDLPGALTQDVLQPALRELHLPAEVLVELTRLVDETPLTSSLVQAVNVWVSQVISSRVRLHGAPWEPATTWQEQMGSCRDLAWFLIAMMRKVGIPARFVSGYHFAPTLEAHELHAWVEVYLPGGGWVGLDPTTGLAVDEAYVPIAASANPEDTMPVSGAFSGPATATLDAWVTLEQIG
ncbi:MAG: transglutaminase family protein [Bacteroidia bacterium]|nr:transglutaminase family protein [Bacteroidia bacterium]